MTIIEVNDGQIRWNVDRAELIAALKAQGWTRSGNQWSEPQADDEDEIGEAYGTLCGALASIEGDAVGTFTYDPSDDVWVLEG